jgi:16S rRNA (guanine527-N7)-methyltransferase
MSDLRLNWPDFIFQPPFSVSREILEKIDIYHELLLKWQKTINLVSLNTLANAVERHFLDSLQLIKFLPEENFTLADMGSGAGFPALVLAMARSDAAIHVIESDARKCEFIRTVSRETKTPIHIHNDRVENVHIRNIDILSARALADLKTLFTLSERFWTENEAMVFVAPKGVNAQSEIKEAEKDFSFSYRLEESLTDAQASIIIASDFKRKKR